MSLQFQVETLDGLDDGLKSLYTEQDGKFVLGIEGLPKDNSVEYEERIQQMDAKVNELLGEKKKADQKRREAEELAKKEAADLAKKSGDTEALEASWQEKYDSTVSELKGQFEPKVAELEGLLRDATVTTRATQIAAELAVPGSAKALMPHIQSRLAMDIKDGKASTIVTDASGKPSALTLEELKNEFIGDEAFAPLIVGSKATGGGANGSDGGAGTKTLKRADFSTKTPNEQMEFVKGGGQIID
jgi:hypothetical protein